MDPFDFSQHDRADPDPWLALYADKSVPMDDTAKRALILTSRSPSRQFLLPILRPFLRLLLGLFQLYRILLPNFAHSSKWLHRILVFGMKHFVQPEANLLVLRHFHLGSQVVEFLARNVEGVSVKTEFLFPKKIDDLVNHLFVQHDVNLYNLVIDLNRALNGRAMKLKQPVDWSCIEPCPLRLEDMPKRWTNFLDLETAIELYVPMFQLLLKDKDFWRATQSLQLDETIGIYYATLFQRPDRLFMLNNKHPLVPRISCEAAYRLMLHGLSTEFLHSFLLGERNRAESATPHAP